jgi:hypothetical protein
VDLNGMCPLANDHVQSTTYPPHSFALLQLTTHVYFPCQFFIVFAAFICDTFDFGHLGKKCGEHNDE